MPGLTQSQTQSLLDDLGRQGATILKRSKNVYRITFPDDSVIVAHSSPSDVNWHRHLKRATEKAGLHWPLEDRAALKRKIKEKEGRGVMTQFVTQYGKYNQDYISVDSRNKVAQFLTGKGRSTQPQIAAATGLSSPTITRALLALGWLQEAEREKETFLDAKGLKRAKMNTFWSPAPESVLASIEYRDTASIPRKKATAGQPKVKVLTVQEALDKTQERTTENIKQAAATAGFEVFNKAESKTFTPDPDDSLPGLDAEPEPTPEPEPLVVSEPAPAEGPMDPDQKDWFEEAANQEERAVKAEARVAELKASVDGAAAQILRLSGELSDARADDTSWAAPGIDDLPDDTTVAGLFSTLRLMGLAPEIRLRKGAAA